MLQLVCELVAGPGESGGTSNVAVVMTTGMSIDIPEVYWQKVCVADHQESVFIVLM